MDNESNVAFVGSEKNVTVDHSVSSIGVGDKSSDLARRESPEASQDPYCEEAILSTRDLEFDEMAVDGAATCTGRDGRTPGSSPRHGRRRSRSSSQSRSSTHHRCSVRRRHNSCVDFTFFPRNKFFTNTSKLLKLNSIFERAADRHSGGIREDRLLKMIPVISPTKIKYGHLKSKDRSSKDRKNVVNEQALRIISRGPFLAMFAYENLNFVNSMAVNEKQEREKIKARKDGDKKKKTPKGSNSSRGNSDKQSKVERINELVSNNNCVDGDLLDDEALLTDNTGISSGRGRANTAPTATDFEQLQVDALTSATTVSGNTADRQTFTKQEIGDTSPNSFTSLESTGSLGDESDSVVSLSDPCAAGTRTKVDKSRGAGYNQSTAGTKKTKTSSKRHSSQKGAKRHKHRVVDSDSNAFLQDENSSIGSSRSTKTRNRSRSSSPHTEDRTGRRRARTSSSRRSRCVTRDSSVDSSRSGASISQSSRGSSLSIDDSFRSLSGAHNSTQNSFVPFVVSTTNSSSSSICNVSHADGSGSSSIASARMKIYQDAQTSTEPFETNGHTLLQIDSSHSGWQAQSGTADARKKNFFRGGHVKNSYGPQFDGISHCPGLTATETLSSEARQTDTGQSVHPDEEIWNLSSYSMTSDEEGEQGEVREGSLPNMFPKSERLAVGNRRGCHFITDGSARGSSQENYGDECTNCPLASIVKLLRQAFPSFYKQNCVSEQRDDLTTLRQHEYQDKQNASFIFRGADRPSHDQARAVHPTNAEGAHVAKSHHPIMYYPQGAIGFTAQRLDHALQYQHGMNSPNVVAHVQYPGTASQHLIVRPRFASPPLNEISRAGRQSYDEEMTPFAGMKLESPFDTPTTNDYSNSTDRVYMSFDERMERESMARSQDEEFRVEKH